MKIANKSIRLSGVTTLIAFAALSHLPAVVSRAVERDEMDLVDKCVNLSKDVYEDIVTGANNVVIGNADQKYYLSRDQLDAVLIEKDSPNARCIIAFRGTTGTPFLSEDWKQNLDGGTAMFQSKTDPSKTCTTTRGFRDAYHNDIQAAIEEEIDTSCANHDLVFTGHSQGGALALIGGARYEARSPRVITFGVAPTFCLDDSCPMLPESAVSNYFNTEDDGSPKDTIVQFDVVPFLTDYFDIITGLAGIGFYFKGEWFAMVPSDSPSRASLKHYARKSDIRYVESDVFDFRDGFVSAHSMNGYADKIGHLANKNSNIPADGFPTFAACNDDDMCEAGHCTSHGFCTTGADHEPCGSDDDCDSGDCDRLSFTDSEHRCDPLGRKGDACNIDHCLPNLACEMTITGFRCVDKLGRGEGCNENSDCISNNCYREKWWHVTEKCA